MGFVLVFSDIHLWASIFSVVLVNYIFMDGKCDYFQGRFLVLQTDASSLQDSMDMRVENLTKVHVLKSRQLSFIFLFDLFCRYSPSSGVLHCSSGLFLRSFSTLLLISLDRKWCICSSFIALKSHQSPAGLVSEEQKMDKWSEL